VSGGDGYNHFKNPQEVSRSSVFSNVSSVVSMFNRRVHLISTYQLTLTCKLDFTS